MNEIEANILRMVGENIDSPDVFTDDAAGLAQIRGSINDAIQELTLIKGSYQRTYLLGLLENRQFYRLAPQMDYIAYPMEVWDRKNKRKLSQISLATLDKHDPWWMKISGTMTHYLWLGTEHIGIYRKPATKGTVLEIKCVCIPKPYTVDGAPIRLRPINRKTAEYLGVSEFYASRGDAARATEFLKKYLEAGDLAAFYPMQNERQWQKKENKDVGS